MHKCFKKGMILVLSIGMIGMQQIHVEASEVTIQAGSPVLRAQELLQKVKNDKEEKDSIIIEETQTEQFTVRDQNQKYDNICFVNIDSDYIYVRSSTSDESDWNGKALSRKFSYTSGTCGRSGQQLHLEISRFIRTEYLMKMEEAQKKIRQMEMEALKNETEVTFSYGETKAEEEARLQAEAEQRAREEAQRKQEQRQAVVDYACQFAGNPYVWGGTSLTNGADCSGFVQSVYAHFGVSLPRTSAAQRSAGYEVSYSEVQPGDIICYSGHVGIYAGNGQIINAQDPAHGIGLSSATYTSILTVRRIF